MFCCNPFKGRRPRGEEEWGDTWRVKMVVVGDSQCGKTSLIQRYCCGTLPHTYTPTLFDAHTTSCLVEERKVQMIIQDTAGQEDLDRLRPPFYLHSDVIIVCFDADNPDSWDKVRKVWVPETRRYCGKHVPLLIVATKGDQASSKTSAQLVPHPDRPDSSSVKSQNDSRGKRDSGGSDSSLSGSSEDLVRADDEKRSLLARTHVRAGQTDHAFGSRQTHRDRHRQGAPPPKALDEALRSTFSHRKTPSPAPQDGKQHLGGTEQRGNRLAAQVGAVRYLETSAVLNQGVQRVFSTALTAAMASKQWRRKYRL